MTPWHEGMCTWLPFHCNKVAHPAAHVSMHDMAAEHQAWTTSCVAMWWTTGVAEDMGAWCKLSRELIVGKLWGDD